MPVVFSSFSTFTAADAARETSLLHPSAQLRLADGAHLACEADLAMTTVLASIGFSRKLDELPR